jgi:RNA polymerase sigma-70 factor (ECF subfamily)
MPPTARPPAAPDTPATPEQLALRAQQGSLDAFSTLVQAFEGRLFNFLLKRTGSPADAEDVAQDTFVRAWERIHQYDPRWRFSTWLFTIGRRLAAGRYRDRPAPPAPLTDASAARAAPSADRLSRREERERIWSVVEELLPPEQHTALWLRYAEDMAIGDIARVLGKSEVGVRVMLFRARAILASRLADPDDDRQTRLAAAPATPNLAGSTR